MKENWVKVGVVGLTCLLLVLLPLFGACAPTPVPPVAPPKPKTEVKIGGLLDLTGGGAYYGKLQHIVWGIFEKWFEGPKPEGYGGIPGVDLKYIVYDFAFKPEEGRIGAKKLITDDKVLVGLPFWGSMTDALVHPMQKEYQVPCVSLGALATVIWPAEESWTFNSYFSYNDQGRAYVDLILKGWKEARKPNFALLCENTPFGQGQVPFMKRYLEVKGIPLVANIAFPSGTVEFGAEITRLMSDKVDFVYSVTALPHYPPILKAMDAAKAPFPLLTPMQGYHSKLLQLAGPAAEGRLYATIRYFDWFDEADPELKKAIGFFSKLLAKEGITEPQKHEYWGGLEAGAECWAIFASGVRAIEICVVDKKIPPEKLTGKDIKEAIETIKNFNCYIDGWGPLVSYSTTDHRALREVGIVTVKGGKYVPAGSLSGVPVPRFMPVGELLPEEKAGKM